MENTLKKLFSFLQKNRKHNKKLQTKYYQSIIDPQNSISEKVISLLYHIVNTQSQPKIDNIASFHKGINKNIECLNSFESFISKLKPNEDTQINYKGLFETVRNQIGWGNKTSALFSKTIYHLHNNEYPIELKIWDDTPDFSNEYDTFFVPVDAVIIAIFKEIEPNTNWNFNNVNKKIKNYYKGIDIEIWDDLWFWGFITQIGSGENREMKWNENKYWVLRETDKNSETIEEIRLKAEEFLSIVKE